MKDEVRWRQERLKRPATREPTGTMLASYRERCRRLRWIVPWEEADGEVLQESGADDSALVPSKHGVGGLGQFSRTTLSMRLVSTQM